eukprot:366511-Chlamydomonas_euryale.AAC.10
MRVRVSSRQQARLTAPAARPSPRRLAGACLRPSKFQRRPSAGRPTAACTRSRPRAARRGRPHPARPPNSGGSRGEQPRSPHRREARGGATRRCVADAASTSSARPLVCGLERLRPCCGSPHLVVLHGRGRGVPCMRVAHACGRCVHGATPARPVVVTERRWPEAMQQAARGLLHERVAQGV